MKARNSAKEWVRAKALNATKALTWRAVTQILVPTSIVTTEEALLVMFMTYVAAVLGVRRSFYSLLPL